MSKTPISPQNKPLVKIPLQTVLIVPIVLQVILATGLVGYLSFRNGQQAVNEVAQQLHREINAQIEQHLRTFLDIPPRINQINANALHQGWLNAGDQPLLERYLWEQIQVFTSVSSIYFGNTAGGLVDAGREVATGSQYVIVTDGFAKGPFRKYATDSQGRRANVLTIVPDFDARTRPWYTSAVEKDETVWGQAYILFTGQDMAISASRPVYDNRRRLMGVVSVDIFLSHLGDFLRSLEIGKTGQSFIMERSGLLLASSTTEPPFITPAGETTPRRLEAGQSTQPLIRGAAQALNDRFGNYQAITAPAQFEFQLDGQRQFLYVSPLHHPSGLDWLVVTVIPEADFMAQITANNRTTLMLSGAALLFAVGLGIFTARWITRPVLRLNASAQNMAKGEWGQMVPNENRIAEINELTQSFNRMSGQLSQTLERLAVEMAEREQLEAELRINLEKYRVLFESFPLGVTVTDNTGKIIETNQMAERILSVPAIEHRLRGLDSPAWQTIRPDETPMPVEEYPAVRALREKRLIENAEMGLVKATGQVTWLNVTAAPLPLEGYGVVIAYGDITDRKRIEETLRESEERYHLLFDNSGDGILLTAPDGRIFAANPAACHMFGRTEAEICQLGRASLVDLTDPRLVAGLEERACMGRVQGELNLLRADGRSFPAELTSVVFRDRTGSLKTSMIIRDITDRKRAEMELRDSEEKYRALFNNELYAICIFDLETLRFLDVNEAYVRLYGYSQAELMAGMTIHDITGEHQDSDAATQQAIREGTIFIPLRHHRKKDGTVFPVEIVGGPYMWQGRRVMFGVAHDITERKRMEEALHESEERYRLIVNNSGDAILLFTPDGHILSANPAACRMFGRTEAEICQLGRGGLADLTDPRLPAAIEERERTGRFRGELNLLRADGHSFSAEVTSEMFRDRTGSPKVSMIIRDITDRKRTEAERERLIAELQSALAQVKQLSGLLPICANCKKIRDDRGYWHQVEAYIRDRTDADFSHGICPDCKKKLYPPEEYPYLYEEKENK